MPDDLDKDLQVLFGEQSQILPEEPFVGKTLRLIEKHRSRRVFMQRLILVLGFTCCALLSPFLIKGSMLLTSGLNSFFEIAGNYLATPLGMLIAGLCTLSFLVFKRRLVF